MRSFTDAHNQHVVSSIIKEVLVRHPSGKETEIQGMKHYAKNTDSLVDIVIQLLAGDIFNHYLKITEESVMAKRRAIENHKDD